MKTERDGKIIHDNGFVQDAKTGRILAPSRQHFITDSARGRELRQRRQEKAQEAAAAGYYEQLIKGDGELPSLEAMNAQTLYILSRTHGKILQSEDPKVIARWPEHMRLLVELTDAIPSSIERRREGENPYGPAAELVGQITELMKLLKDNPPQPETVEGEAKTIEE